MTDNDIDALIAIRERATNRRDEQIDWNAVDLIDAQLAQVPAGKRNDVDLLLGRSCAQLPECVEYQLRPATDTAAATEAVAELAQAKQDEFLMHIADQYADMLDWHRLCGDLAI